MRKEQKGFTIIELLVVIVIIGILVALALPNLFSAQRRGRDTDRKNELKNIQQKLETFYNDNNEYPTGAAITALTAATPAGLGLTEEESEDPRDNPYGYSSEDGTEYELTADLENDDDPDATGGNYVLNSINQE
jgi:type II secretion system protein G